LLSSNSLISNLACVDDIASLKVAATVLSVGSVFAGGYSDVLTLFAELE
jgi:hypothetical protein